MIDQLRRPAVVFQLIPLEGMVAMATASWRARAACAHMDPDLFFTEDLGIEPPALVFETCSACPVSSECLADAARSSDWYEGGVRGGLSQTARRLMPRPRIPELVSA